MRATQNNDEKIKGEYFLWKKVNDKCLQIFAMGLFELYEVEEEGTEHLIETQESLLAALDSNVDICIEVGHVKPKELLEQQDYYMDSLWTLGDVTNKYDITNEGAKGILNSVLNSEYIMEQINAAINETAEGEGFSLIEHEFKITKTKNGELPKVYHSISAPDFQKARGLFADYIFEKLQEGYFGDNFVLDMEHKETSGIYQGENLILSNQDRMFGIDTFREDVYKYELIDNN